MSKRTDWLLGRTPAQQDKKAEARADYQRSMGEAKTAFREAGRQLGGTGGAGSTLMRLGWNITKVVFGVFFLVAVGAILYGCMTALSGGAA